MRGLLKQEREWLINAASADLGEEEASEEEVLLSGQLTERGLVREIETDDAYYDDITALGRLALRVCTVR